MDMTAHSHDTHEPHQTPLQDTITPDNDPFAELLAEALREAAESRNLSTAKARTAFGHGTPDDQRTIAANLTTEWETIENVTLWSRHICPVCSRTHQVLRGPMVRQKSNKFVTSTRMIPLTGPRPTLPTADHFIDAHDGQCGVCYAEGER